MVSFPRCTYPQPVFFGCSMFIISEDGAAVEKNEETKIDGKPVLEFVRFDEGLEFAKNGPLERL